MRGSAGQSCAGSPRGRPTRELAGTNPRTDGPIYFFNLDADGYLSEVPGTPVRTAVLHVVLEVSPRFLALRNCGLVPLRLSPRPSLLSDLVSLSVETDGESCGW